jgi:hypothetical protein
MWRCALPLLALGLTACTQTEVSEQDAFSPTYLGIQTLLLDGDLVNFRVGMKGARDKADVDAYARCAAAQYALIRGYGFARHVRTNVDQTGGVWRGDAIYTISASLPAGLKTIDAEVTVRDCGAQGIPTV